MNEIHFQSKATKSVSDYLVLKVRGMTLELWLDVPSCIHRAIERPARPGVNANSNGPNSPEKELMINKHR